jgi:hypothetical protein
MALGAWLLCMGLPATGHADAKVLHDTHCRDCHAGRFDGQADRVYTRQDRKVRSMDQLRTMVGFCNQQVGTQWFDEDVEAVTHYLNQQFYQFPPVMKK